MQKDMNPLIFHSRSLRLAIASLTSLALMEVLAIQAADVEPQTGSNSSRSRPIPRQDFVISSPVLGSMRLIGMHSESNRLDETGVPKVDATARRFFYLPLFAFKYDTSGLQASLADDGRITIPIIWDIPEAGALFSDHLRRQKLLTTEATEGQIQIVSADLLSIETVPSYSPHVRFDDRNNFVFSNREGSLSTRIPDMRLAAKFLDDFKKGLVWLKAKICFQGYSTKINSAVITYSDLRDTSTYKTIAGAGGRGFVNRHQISELGKEAATNRGITVIEEFADPDFSELVKELLHQMDSSNITLNNGWESLDKAIAENGWDPNDLKADLITATNYTENKDLQTTIQQEASKSGSDAGGFSLSAVVKAVPTSLGVNWNNSSSEAAKIYKQVLDKWGVSFSQTGATLIPKSIDTFSINNAKLNSKGEFTVGKLKRIESEGMMEVDIDPQVNRMRVAETYVEQQIAPVGSVVAFAGDQVPPGWLLCDGTPKKVVEFKALYDAIRNAWGGDSTEFNLPDLRGLFLRGKNADKIGDYKDPEASSRAASKAGGNSGDKVGSQQKGQIESHTHQINDPGHTHRVLTGAGFNPAGGGTGTGTYARIDAGNDQELHMEPGQKTGITAAANGGLETRPVNASVNYIIRAF